MRDLEDWRHQMTAFANAHVQELAAEIIEWQDTALLRDGKLRELGALAQAIAGHDALKVAESFAARAALELAAYSHPDHKDGGANG